MVARPLTMVLAATIVAAMVGCGGRSSLDVPKPLADIDPTEWCTPGERCTVADACADGEVTERRQTLSFNEPTGCVWGLGGNFDQEDGSIRARTEQVAELDLERDSVICGLRFDIPTTSIHYDDHLVVAFNNLILMAALDFEENNPFAIAEDFVVYEWERLRDEPLEFFGTYCVGEEDGLGNCRLPSTETLGTMSLTVDPEVVQRLGYAALKQNRAAFSVITTGDDNPELDCRHSGFDIDVTVTTATLP